MKSTIEILVLARPAVDATEVESCVRAAGHALLAVSRSISEVRACIATRAAASPALVLLVQQDMARDSDIAGAVAALGAPVVYFASGEGAPDPGATDADPITCALVPRELGLAVALAAARGERDRIDSERAEMAEALRQSNQRYEWLFQEAPVFVWEEDLTGADAALDELRARGVTDFRTYFTEDPARALGVVGENAMVRVNDAALRAFGARDAGELQQSFVRIHTPDSISHVVAAITAYAEGQRYWQFEADYAKLSGERVAVLARFVFPTPNMQPRHMLFCGVDVTERKRSEEEIRALNRQLARRAAELEAINAELESFSYSVSHDLRAPLRAIDGFSKLLVDRYATGMDERGSVYLERVREASQRMARLIDDLLQLSRMTRSEMHVQLCDLSAMAGEILDELQQSAPERRVAVDIEPGMEAEADPSLLRAALENLLGNAWKFTSKTADARIEVGTTTRDGRRAYFVRDNGAGFDMAYAQKLFGAFQRLHGAHEFEGTGIGLATVQRIVRRHGGDIWGEGAVDQGATFTFTLS